MNSKDHYGRKMSAGDYVKVLYFNSKEDAENGEEPVATVIGRINVDEKIEVIEGKQFNPGYEVKLKLPDYKEEENEIER